MGGRNEKYVYRHNCIVTLSTVIPRDRKVATIEAVKKTVTQVTEPI